MFCEKCGMNIEGLESCPECEGKGWTGIEKSIQKIDKKLAIRVGIVIAAIIVIVGAVKLIDGGKSSVKGSIVGQVLSLRSGDEYIISKKDIKSVEKIQKEVIKENNSSIEIVTSDITLETDEFNAKGNVEIIKHKSNEQVVLNLKYFPVLGVTDQDVEMDIRDMYLYLDNDINVNVSEYDLTISSIESDNGKFEEAIMTSEANIVLEGDIFKLTGNIIMYYEFDRGVWELQDYTAEQFDTTYVDGKDLVFSLDDLLNEYNRGRVGVSLIGDNKLYPPMTKESLTESSTELIDLYTKRVTLDLNHTTSFYDLEGEVYVYYTLYGDTWDINRLEANPIYKFNLDGNYAGWYEMPKGWYDEVARRNNATLEITKTNNSTGDYEGIFNFEDITTDAEDNEQIIEGSYYVTGRYNPMFNGDLDKWEMRAEKWINQLSGFSLKNLSGVVDNESKMFKGDIVSYSDTFELKKDK